MITGDISDRWLVSRKWVYVLCELDGNIVLCDWDTDAGVLSPRQSICKN